MMAKPHSPFGRIFTGPTHLSLHTGQAVYKYGHTFTGENQVTMINPCSPPVAARTSQKRSKRLLSAPGQGGAAVRWPAAGRAQPWGGEIFSAWRRTARDRIVCATYLTSGVADRADIAAIGSGSSQASQPSSVDVARRGLDGVV